MNRIRFQLIFGGLSLLLLAYVACCWRTFLIGAAEPPLTELPSEFRSSAIEEIRSAGLLGREEFRWERAMELLIKPYETTPPQIQIKTPESDLVCVSRGYSFSSVIFANYHTGWARVPDNCKIP